MVSNYFKVVGISGERKLKGAISVSGAKNAALKIMASSILFSDHVELTNVPEIEDVNRIGELLEGLGMKIESSINHRKILVPKVIKSDLLDGPARATRSSIVLTGPLLARTGRVSFPNPGGCSFGNRPIDLFIEGFEKMGAKIVSEGEVYIASAPKGLTAMEFFFKVQSHTGTETLMMAATLAKGITVLKNCALEPEVKSLADFLNSCGANIKGAGTSTITIEGGKVLSSNKNVYETMPDRIEAGSFLILGALSAEKLTIKNCSPEHLEIAIEILRTAGVRVEVGVSDITVYGKKDLKAVNVRTHEYPGLATDLQAPMAVFLTQVKGESALFETIYEGRLGYVPDLVSMGANITLQDSHRALINGATDLLGRKMKAPDLRGGFAFIIAAIISKGESIIENAYVIERGYEKLTERLTSIGVNIVRL